MNYLAHLYLADSDPDALVGSLMGDFVKGAIDATRLPGSPALARAIVQHRHIDSFTDAHAVVQRSKQRIRPPYRRYAGILVDVFYDHYLAITWQRYSDVELAAFAQSVYRVMMARLDTLPPRMQRSMRYMIRADLLVSYRDIDGVGRALLGIESRLSRPSGLSAAISELKDNYAELASDFDAFFPQLREYVERQAPGVD
ncbi:MAG: DUF479 domain-containing protein [Gammaproteobacteria bacterium]|nr:DUF479 domain-containing protein [Gammaproteobacteria bacterium]